MGNAMKIKLKNNYYQKTSPSSVVLLAYFNQIILNKSFKKSESYIYFSLTSITQIF